MPGVPLLIEIGRVTRGHGIRGEIKIEGAPDFLEALATVKRIFVSPAGEDARSAERIDSILGFAAPVVKCRLHQSAALVLIRGVATRNDSEALRGARIFAFEADLPELSDDEYYAHDLIGLQVVDEAGGAIGELVDVLATGANDVYVIQGPAGERLLPAIESVIKAIDLEAGLIRVAVPEGL